MVGEMVTWRFQFHGWLVALSETHRPHSFLIFTSHKRRTARGASGGSLNHLGPSFRKPYGEHSFRAFHLLFLLTWAPCWLSLPFHFVTTWLRPSDTAHVPPFRVRDVCRRWHCVPLLGPRASTLSAANLSFSHPPTPTQGSCSGVSSEGPLPTQLALD